MASTPANTNNPKNEMNLRLLRIALDINSARSLRSDSLASFSLQSSVGLHFFLSLCRLPCGLVNRRQEKMDRRFVGAFFQGQFQIWHCFLLPVKANECPSTINPGLH